MVREQSILAGALRLRLASGPASGPPLMLLHGVTRRWQTFLPILPALSLRWQCHAIDFRGHGGSGHAAGRYFVADYAGDATAAVRHVGEPAVVYGHSLGAMVAAATAADLPDLVRAVVLEDPPFETMGSRIRQTRLHSYFAGLQALAGSQKGLPELAREIAELRYVDPESGESIRAGDIRDAASLRFAAACLQRLDPDVLTPIAAGRWLQGYDRDAILQRIRCPVLLLQADDTAGGMLTDEDAAACETLIADCTRVRMPQVNHLMHWSRTQDVVNVVTSFLESVRETD